MTAPRGEVVSIHIAFQRSEPMHSVEEAVAVAGSGLAGDRYAAAEGTFSRTPGTGREATLIEIEALEAFRRETGIEMTPAHSRRNIATRGIRLNDLVGKTFRVGDSILAGARLCEPCSHLENLTGTRLIPGMTGRAGLRADILAGGTIRVGDPIVPVDAPPGVARRH